MEFTPDELDWAGLAGFKLGERQPEVVVCDYIKALRYSAVIAGSTMTSKYAFSQGLKELRFLFCQTSEHSAATRNFLLKTYPAMKKQNPHTPIMIREASGTQPTVYARFDFGKEKKLPLTGLDNNAIEQKVSELVSTDL